MSKSKRIWGILGSSAIILLSAISQSSVHASPTTLLPAWTVATPAKMTSIAPTATQGVIATQRAQIPMTGVSKYFSRPANLTYLAKIIGQFMLALYGVSMVCVGRGAGGATKSRATVVWGSLFVVIALTAPELINWVMTNSATATSPAAGPAVGPTVFPRVGGCG